MGVWGDHVVGDHVVGVTGRSRNESAVPHPLPTCRSDDRTYPHTTSAPLLQEYFAHGNHVCMGCGGGGGVWGERGTGLVARLARHEKATDLGLRPQAGGIYWGQRSAHPARTAGLFIPIQLPCTSLPSPRTSASRRPFLFCSSGASLLPFSEPSLQAPVVLVFGHRPHTQQRYGNPLPRRPSVTICIWMCMCVQSSPRACACFLLVVFV